MSNEVGMNLIHGTVAAGYEPVRAAFANNWTAFGEVGATYVVLHRGKTLVDLRGGYCDPERTRALPEDALFNVWSTTKGLSSICIAVLVDRGVLDYEAPVARYWPEFAAHGKGTVTVAQMLSHQAGVCGPATPVTLEDSLDHTKIATLLAQQEPFFAPGSYGYHTLTFGNLVDELIRRVDGRTLGVYFAEEIAGPAGADAYIGLPEAQDHRQVPMVPAAAAPLLIFEAPLNPAASWAAFQNPVLDATWPNRRDWRAAGMGGAGGSANARGLARIYGALLWGDPLSARPLIRRETLQVASTERIRGPSQISDLVACYAAGFALNLDGRWGPNPLTFGHGGWGGSVACADLQHELVIAYAMNQMGSAVAEGDPRLVSLIKATYACLDVAGS